jgi:N utilization substance protein B
MAVRSKRKAREAALRALYEIEVGHADVASAIEVTLEEANLPPEVAAYAEKLIRGVKMNLPAIDRAVSPLIREYDFKRIAVVDRNVLRIAAYELLELPEIPPAVTINEAIEIAKRYSTAESGKFVNGVLGALLKQTPKANWDPSAAPPEDDELVMEDPEPEIEEEVVQEGSEEAKVATRYGIWTLRSGDAKIPSNTEEN